MGHEGHDHDHPHTHPEPHRNHPELVEGPSDLHSVSEAHRAHAPTQVASFVITCSDTRSAHTDEGGALAASLLEAAGHPIVGRKLVKDEPAEIRVAIEDAKGLGARAIVLTGGTGIGARDGTIEAVRAWFQQRGGKELPGFGELFRMLSFQEIGAAAMLSRATAGTFEGVIVFALPGSPKAVRLALEKLVLPELGHAIRELMR